MNIQRTLIAVTAGLLLFAAHANAKESEKSIKAEKAAKPELFPKDNRTYSQKEFDRNERQVRKETDRQQAEKRVESMRDKSHDGRIPVGKNTSVGGQSNPPSVNVRKTIP